VPSDDCCDPCGGHRSSQRRSGGSSRRSPRDDRIPSGYSGRAAQSRSKPAGRSASEICDDWSAINVSPRSHSGHSSNDVLNALDEVIGVDFSTRLEVLPFSLILFTLSILFP